MNLRSKLIIMVMIPTLTLGFLALFEVRQTMNSVAETDRAHELILFTSKFSSMVHELQKERSLSTAHLGSSSHEFAEKLPKQYKLSDRKIIELKSHLNDFDVSAFGESFPTKLENALRDLAKIKQKRQAILKKEISYIDALDYYTETLNGQFLDFIVELVNLSSFKQSGEFNAFANFFQSKELVGIERAIISNVLTTGKFSNDMYERFTKIIYNQETYNEIFSNLANDDQKRFYEEILNDPIFTEVARMRSLILSKQKLVDDLYTVTGDGGLINHFNDYLLHGEEKDIYAFNQDFEKIINILNGYRKRTYVSDPTRQDLVALSEALNRYKKGFDTLVKMLGEGKSVETIDAAVKVNGDLVFKAMRQITTSGFGIEPFYWFNAQTNKINLLRQVEDKLTQSLLTRTEDLSAAASAKSYFTLLLTLITLGVTIFVALFYSRSIFKQVGDEPSHLQEIAKQIADGNLEAQIKGKTGIAASINEMIVQLRAASKKSSKQLWISDGLRKINGIIRNETEIRNTASEICKFMAKYLNAQILTFYTVEEDNLKLVGSYAFDNQMNPRDTIKIGEGFIGQAALEKATILITEVPEDYSQISSSIGESYPRNIVVIPLVADNTIRGVIEIGSFLEFSDDKLEFLESLKEPIGIAIRSINEKIRVNKLLTEAKEQSRELECHQEELVASNQHLAKQASLLKDSEERLHAQQEELRVSNNELEEHMNNLKRSEERLQAQEEELRASNEELEEKAITLKEQRNIFDVKKREAEAARNEVELKAEELERANSYKSDFLASMSHELRTPLNSLLILAKLLQDNNDENLTEKQVEFARTIHQAGNDLLTLINDILDLSKVEAGKLEVNWEKITLAPWITHLEKTFRHVADKKGLGFSVTISDNVPEMINSDSTRAAQILKNLLSNAFKFTAKGEISLNVEKPSNGLQPVNDSLTLDKTIAFKISDTGIGLSEDKQKIIFEAFQQADSKTTRKYGGTGLGLSISRELAKLLGGELHLKSEEGKGSTFTLLLPICHPEVEVTDSDVTPDNRVDSTEPDRAVKLEVSRVRDDRRELTPGDKSVLMVDDDPVFLEILSELAHEKGFKTLVAGDGHTGLHLADYYQPSAIILDIKMPEINGFDVMERLKENPRTRFIPVHFISGDDRTAEVLEKGAIGLLMKPVSAEDIENCFEKFETLINDSIKSVLIVEDSREQQKNLKALLEVNDITSTAIGTGEEAVELLKNNKFDCMILDIGLAGEMTGFELADKIKNDNTIPHIPIIVYTGRNLSDEEEILLKKCSDSIILKGINSPGRLTDEVNLFLHKVENELPENHKNTMNAMYSKDESLGEKKVLIVDDDMRNVFALSSAIQDQGMSVTIGKNGREGIDQLEAHPDVNLILMDIMMPEMDGYEAMREIRMKDKFKDLPIIALTAKAMKGEKERCTEAGASDYLSKPVDTEKLLSLMRVWMHQK